MKDLAHFTNADDLLLDDRAYEQRPNLKPRGFWMSDESEGSDGWSYWCTSEQYDIGANRYAVELAPTAHILNLTTVESIRGFHAEFEAPPDSLFIDWPRVAERWDGIIITPYQWKLRLAFDASWYYGWDCASGCIWDLSAIASVRRFEPASCGPAGSETGATDANDR